MHTFRKCKSAFTIKMQAFFNDLMLKNEITLLQLVVIFYPHSQRTDALLCFSFWQRF